MHRRVGSRLAFIPVASFLFLTGVPRMSAAIALENDVSIDFGNCIDAARPRCAAATVVGAPRTVGDRTPVDFIVTIERGAAGDARLEVTAYDDQLRELCVDRQTGCRASLHLVFPGDGTFRLQLPLDGFPSQTAILALNGHVGFGQAILTNPKVTIVVSSEGDPILADRIGDVNLDPGDAADIPPRSIDVVRALNRFEEGPFRTRAVELDAVGSGTNIAVGWTHAFIASDTTLRRRQMKTATLTLLVASGDPCMSNDVILLDQAVDRIATGRRSRLPVIVLRDLQECPTSVFASGRYRFTIDLMNVPVRILSLDDLSLSDPTEENLTRNLEDGTLNVIVAGHSAVHDSALDITLKESEDR